MSDILTVVPADSICRRSSALNEQALNVARNIVADVESRGEVAVYEAARRLDGLGNDDSLFIERPALERSLDDVSRVEREALERTAGRISRFAESQRDSLSPLDTDIDGVPCGHTVSPVEAAGCYAPGGRYPLPSSALMTAVTARTAGVRSVWLASPNPSAHTLAAAAVADADGVLKCGGAQAIAALALGCGPVPPSDIIVGPGSSYVTAAKFLVSRWCRIDMLAGPSELVVVADGTASADMVAADLLAQAEHDTEAVVTLIALEEGLIERVRRELSAQLPELESRDVAAASLRNGFACLVGDIEEAARVCDRLAPEHLQLNIVNAGESMALFRKYGAIFVGHVAGEVIGDYGCGPNHVLPTGGTGAARGGLSALDFLVVRTWIADAPTRSIEPVLEDAELLANLEGLPGHARAAALRLARGLSKA